LESRNRKRVMPALLQFDKCRRLATNLNAIPHFGNIQIMPAAEALPRPSQRAQAGSTGWPF